MYNNPFMNNVSNQATIERINNEISNLQKMKEQMQHPAPSPTNLTQNFQIAPTSRDIVKYATSMEDVQREMVVGDTPFFSKDMSVVWIKNVRGDIKTYELTEIVPKDEKDIKIEYLQAQIEELKEGLNKYERFDTDDISTKDKTDTSGNDESVGEPTKKVKSTSVSRISTSKKK